jgi:hypothetical protein
MQRRDTEPWPRGKSTYNVARLLPQHAATQRKEVYNSNKQQQTARANKRCPQAGLSDRSKDRGSDRYPGILTLCTYLPTTTSKTSVELLEAAHSAPSLQCREPATPKDRLAGDSEALRSTPRHIIQVLTFLQRTAPTSCRQLSALLHYSYRFSSETATRFVIISFVIAALNYET